MPSILTQGRWEKFRTSITVSQFVKFWGICGALALTFPA
jgi:hypothetical protein